VKPPKPAKIPRVTAAKNSSKKKKNEVAEVEFVEVVQNTTRSGRTYKNKDLNSNSNDVVITAIATSVSSISNLKMSFNNSSSSSSSNDSSSSSSKPVQELAEEDECQLIARTSSVGRSISITRSSSTGHGEEVDLGGHKPNHVCTVLYR